MRPRGASFPRTPSLPNLGDSGAPRKGSSHWHPLQAHSLQSAHAPRPRMLSAPDGGHMTRYPVVALAVLLFGVPPVLAQAPLLNLPQPSPSASVTQQVGVTEIAISYHRPAVGKRKIWGSSSPMTRCGAPAQTRTRPLPSPVR